MKLLILFLAGVCGLHAAGRDRSSVAQARDGETRQSGLVGCNSSPRAAITQLELWQVEVDCIRTVTGSAGTSRR